MRDGRVSVHRFFIIASSGNGSQIPCVPRFKPPHTSFGSTLGHLFQMPRRKIDD